MKEKQIVVGSKKYSVKECPFCHSVKLGVQTPEGSEHSFVSCSNCLSEGPIDRKQGFTSVERAVELWNSR